MKNKTKLVGIFLVALLGFTLSAAPALAKKEHTEGAPGGVFSPQASPASDQPSVDSAPEEEIGGVDKTFDVSKLTAPGQKSRVPSKDQAKNVEEGRQGIVGILADAISLLVKITGSISLIVFILGALMMIASEGKSDRLEKGKGIMLYAIYGLLISLFAFIIVTFVQSILF